MNKMKYSEEERLELARSIHAGMLHDDERHQKYYEALKRTIVDLKAKGRKHIRALDIGGGTGILSMMAAKAGAEIVTMCESFKPMSDIAREIIKKNNLDAAVDVFGIASNELQVPRDMKEKADVLVTEIFDSELIGEGVLPTLRDAHERLLLPDCQVIPSSATLNIQLIESDTLWSTNKIKFDCLHLRQTTNQRGCRGWAAPHEIQSNQLYPNHLKLLSNVHEVKSFSFRSPHPCSSGKHSPAKVKVPVTQAGIVHALILWWDLVLHEDGITLSMKPDWINEEGFRVWRDHWMQVVYYLSEPMHVTADDIVFATMYNDDYSIWFDVSTKMDKEFVDRPLCSCGWHLSCSRERFAMHNHSDVRSCYEKLAKRCEIYRNSLITIFGDTSLLPIFFSKNGFKNLRYVECASFSKNNLQNLYDCNESIKPIEILSLSSVEIMKLKSDVVLFEPYSSSSLLPWQNMQIWKRLDKVRRSNVDVKLFPQKAFLKACVVSLDDLWQIRQPVKAIEGFDLSIYDTFIDDVISPINIAHHGCFDSVEPYAMWEYRHKITSEIYVLNEFDFLQSPSHEKLISFVGDISTAQSGFSNAIVIWMDFELDDGIVFHNGLNEDGEWVKYCKQGLYFMKSHIFMESGARFRYKVLFDTSQWEMLVSFDVCC